jgi:hypothetical protein
MFEPTGIISLFRKSTGEYDGVFTFYELKKYIPEEQKWKQILYSFYVGQSIEENENLTQSQKEERHRDRVNYRRIMELKPGDFVRYMGIDGDNFTVRCGFKLGEKYEISKGPFIYTPNGSLSVFVYFKRDNQIVAEKAVRHFDISVF